MVLCYFDLKRKPPPQNTAGSLWFVYFMLKVFFSNQSSIISSNGKDATLIASEAKWASASARSKLYLTNGYLEKTKCFCISETKHFGHMVLGIKSVCFDSISRYMEWTGPTRPDATRPDPARPSRFWEAYNSETVDYTEKSYHT